jgi:uncharacterized protein (TIGR00304 family)
MVNEFLWNAGIVLIFVGFALSFIIMLLLVFSGKRDGGRGKVRGGGAVIIGPVPIVFGTDKESVKIILILSIILVALLLVFTVILPNILR